MGNKNQLVKKEELDINKIIPPPNPQLKFKVLAPIPEIEITAENLVKSIMHQLEKEKIKTIHELSNNKIGVLIDYSLIIYSSKTFKVINSITLDKKLLQGDYKDIFYSFKDFIQLQNNNLILNTNKSLFFIKVIDNNYKCELSQISKEYKQHCWVPSFAIYSVKELKDGRIVSCSNCGFKIYKKEGNEYEQISNIRNGIDEASANRIFDEMAEFAKYAFNKSSDCSSLIFVVFR